MSLIARRRHGGAVRPAVSPAATQAHVAPPSFAMYNLRVFYTPRGRAAQ